MFIKSRVKDAVEHINYFEETAANEASERGYEGVVCGHIHHPALKKIGGITYMNDGDWVENCTVLVEKFDGNVELLHWTDRKESIARWSAAADDAITTEVISHPEPALQTARR